MSQPEKQVIGSVEYQTADKGYFDKRGLKRYAGGAYSFGEFGAWVALLIAAAVLLLLFDNPGFRPGIIGVAIWFLCGLLYFAVHGRKTLVYSPEEEFAIAQSQHSGRTP